MMKKWVVTHLPGILSTIVGSLLLALNAGAQVDTGAILGIIKDQTGAVVPGAKVSLTNEGTYVANDLGAERPRWKLYIYTRSRGLLYGHRGSLWVSEGSTDQR